MAGACARCERVCQGLRVLSGGHALALAAGMCETMLAAVRVGGWVGGWWVDGGWVYFVGGVGVERPQASWAAELLCGKRGV